eukprot:CAMPEP_0197712358 /NCGR_PEP_ID=MMETSP1338-20131121/129917_1 /TAXON_ID=43686 ORGANISM="Pelagodinium beii, Strain RCC1491" /NCGR_SAMPLE_ID=MMETSP1338 /ASSEMBLY_ACC=CAM_ASM_000754 /LENGTH=81 /DNA_ID=CAMNT_0043296293 /DNA_START=121 /DNA_END=367 /DNA_ORIENTATION=-
MAAVLSLSGGGAKTAMATFVPEGVSTVCVASTPSEVFASSSEIIRLTLSISDKAPCTAACVSFSAFSTAASAFFATTSACI